MKISVVVCTYNRVKFIRACLEHLANQTMSSTDYEVIVVNNNCSDGTEEVVSTFIAEHKDYNFRQVLETNQGLSFARNRGIKEAQSELIFYIDDDGEAKQDTLELIHKVMTDNPGYVGIGGKVIPRYEGEAPEWLTYHLRMMVTHIDYGENKFKCYGKKFPPGCNMTYRKNVLEQVGGFNESLKWRTDDKYIFLEVAKISDEVYFIPEIEVAHNIDRQRTTDKSFDFLSLKLGQEERFRTLDISTFSYCFKVIEYVLKYFASIALAIGHTLKGKSIIGKYLIRFRWLALKGLLQGE